MLPVTKQSLVVHNKLSFERVESNLTPSCFNYLIQIANMVKAMTYLSSIKQKIFAKMLSEEFLVENILAQKHTQVTGTNMLKVLKIYQRAKF